MIPLKLSVPRRSPGKQASSAQGFQKDASVLPMLGGRCLGVMLS